MTTLSEDENNNINHDSENNVQRSNPNVSIDNEYKNNNEEDVAIAEMERLLAQQEEDHHQEQQQQQQQQEIEDEPMNHNDDHNNDNDLQQDRPQQLPQIHPTAAAATAKSKSSFLKANYTSISLLLTTIHILYILRTRKQIYLSLMYLTTSRLSYILIANSILATLISFYHKIIKTFLNGGLRFIESETISDSIRWNITESIFALTMFRSEVTVKLMICFVIVFWGKCLHWAVDLRGSHLRMTQEVFYFLNDDDEEDDIMMNEDDSLNSDTGINMNFNNDHHRHNNNNNNISSTSSPKTSTSSSKALQLLSYILPQSTFTSIQTKLNILPRIHSQHFYYWTLINILYTFDIVLIAYFSNEILQKGPSAHILFLFDSTIMLISVLSCYFLYLLHVVDGLVNVVQRLCSTTSTSTSGNMNNSSDDNNSEEKEQEEVVSVNNNASRHQIIIGRLASTWKDSRATANFSIELMSLSAKFLLHLILFITVFATYGLPISIIRDFYMAYLKLRNRLSAFVSYRKLTMNMDKRFQSITNDADLDNAGRTCIICRDLMDIHGIHGICKKLPMCGHAFHKHCLREWLVQQNSCPTCRADIQVNEARAVVYEVGEEEGQEGEQQQESDQDNVTAGADNNIMSNDRIDIEETNHEIDTNDKNSNDENDWQGLKFNHQGEYREKYVVNTASMDCATLYKVIKNVPIVDFVDHENNSSSSVPRVRLGNDLIVKRVIQAGTHVIGTETKLWIWRDRKIKCNEEIIDKMLGKECLPSEIGSDVFLKIPDGDWIRQTDLMKVLELKY